MRSKMGWNNVAKGAGILVLAAGCFGWGQFEWPKGVQPAVQVPLGGQPAGFGDAASDTLDPIIAEKRLRALNADRHKSLVSDTEKLLKLARQLDAEIASNPTGQLTPEELHKVAVIEKLAHNVKTKMAESFGGGPQLKPPMGPLSAPGVVNLPGIP
jgi:hypothetical protein